MSADSPQRPASPDEEASVYSAAPNADPEASRYEQTPGDTERTNYVGPDSAGQTGSWQHGGGRDRDLPRRFGNYELLAEIARGGMGVVYRARQVGPGGQTLRTVALKMILAGSEANAEVIQRFWTEAQTASAINHPNIVRIFEVGESEGRPFFSMELVEGGSLSDLVRNGPLPPREAAWLVEQVADGVQAVHEQGVIHRDLKPQNVLLASGVNHDPGVSVPGCSPAPLARSVPKLTDFGLARTREGGGSVTGDQLGTPSYMAPEQAAGKVREVSAATDVYGLGAVLYCLLTGRPPFSSSSVVETTRLVIDQEPVQPCELNPAVPRELETVCLKCLEKPAAKRYHTARELSEELGRFREGRPVLAQPVGPLERGWRWCKRNPLVTSLLTLVFLLTTTGTVTALLLKEQAETQSETAKREKSRAEKGERVAEKEALEAINQKEFIEYVLRVRDAQTQLEEGYIDDARERLYQCKPKFWEWEHDYLLLQTLKLQLDKTALTSAVYSVACSTDGKHLLSGHYDHTLKVWDAATGQEKLTLKGHTARVHSVTFSANGKQIVSGSEDKTLKVWDPDTGQEKLTLTGHTSEVRSVAFSPEGKRILSGSNDKTLKVWDAATGEERLTLTGHAEFVTSAAFSIDGKSIVSGSWDKTLKVWDADTGQEKFTLTGHTSGVTAVALSADGKWIASGSDDRTLKVWDALTGQEALTLKGHTKRVNTVTFSPEGNRILSGSEDKTVKLWDTATGQEAVTLKGHTSAVYSVCVSANGKCILSGSGDVVSTTLGEVRVWYRATRPEAFNLKGHTEAVTSVAFSADGNRIVSGSWDKTLKVWDAATGYEALTLQGHTSGVTSVAFSADGKRIVSGSDDKTLKVWDAATGREELTLTGHPLRVTSVAFSPDGKRIVSGSNDRAVKVWDAATGKDALTLKGLFTSVHCVAFSPDGRRFVSGDDYCKVRIWDAATGHEERTLTGHKCEVYTVAFSPDGKRIVSGGGQGLDKKHGEIKVWDAATGEIEFTLEEHALPVLALAFSRDGKRLVSGSQDKTLKIWDAATGREELTLKGHTMGIRGVAFSPDGKRMISASSDKKLKVWDAPPPSIP